LKLKLKSDTKIFWRKTNEEIDLQLSIGKPEKEEGSLYWMLKVNARKKPFCCNDGEWGEADGLILHGIPEVTHQLLLCCNQVKLRKSIYRCYYKYDVAWTDVLIRYRHKY
jgi:hypothetical protein